MKPNEHDGAIDTAALPRPLVQATQSHVQSAHRVPKLMARVVVGASQPLRVALLSCLLRPLGPLALLAIASGAFAKHVRHDPGGSLLLSPDGQAQHSTEQISELVGFVQQVSPDALNQVASLLTDSQFGAASFSAAAAVLLVHAVHGARQRRRRNADAQAVR